MTVKTRITLLIVGAGFVASLIFSAVVFYELVEQPFKILDTILKEEAYRTARRVGEWERGSAVTPPGSASQALYPYWMEISDPDNRKVLFRSHLAKTIRLSPVAPGSSAIASATVTGERIDLGQDENQKVTFRVRTYRVPLNSGTFVVQIARPMGELKEEIRDLLLGIFSGLVFSTLALIAISRFVAGKILQPIGRIQNLAHDISEKNLDQRIPTGTGQDEFSELARTINRMLDRLQCSFERQRTFLFDTSHELKTPLTTMRLAVDEICACDREELPPFIKDNLLRVNHQVLRMDRLVKDLLNLSALETMTHIDPKPVPITALLESLADEYRFLADAHNITLDVRLSNELVAHGDAEKLHRAFSNILDNAVKYNVAGGWIELQAGQSHGELQITIANTGPGLADEEIPKVFDQFYRVEKSRSIAHGGSGLGLAMVKRIVELHGGEVQLESLKDGWTRVTVRLPLS